MPRNNVSRQTYDAFHRRQRQSISLFRHAYDERLTDRQREWQTNREARSLAEGRIDEQTAAQFFDLGGDHIHADSAARRLRDMAGGAETGLQYELHGLFIRDFRVGVGQPERNGFLADQLDIDAGAIVR